MQSPETYRARFSRQADQGKLGSCQDHNQGHIQNQSVGDPAIIAADTRLSISTPDIKTIISYSISWLISEGFSQETFNETLDMGYGGGIESRTRHPRGVNPKPLPSNWDIKSCLSTFSS